MARPNNYFSTLFAMGFVICLPLGILSTFLRLILNQMLYRSILDWMGFIGFILIFFGGIFFILHFIFKMIEKGETDVEHEILDDDMMN